MANGKQASTKRLKMAERAEKQREVLFPEVQQVWLWHRKKNDGFITIPRTLPIVMEVIDSLSKSQPAGHTYFGVWCRSPDHSVVTIENPAIFASEAGFKGERAVDTWRRRMKTLRDLRFILTKEGPAGDFHYVLLLNPNMVIEHLKAEGKVQDGLYAKFLDRTLEIGSYGEIEGLRDAWAAQAAAQAAAAEQVAVQPAAESPKPPPPPPPQS